MNCFFKEASFQRTERILKFLSEDKLINSGGFSVLAIGYWHGNRWRCKSLAKQHDFTILRYHYLRPGIKHFWIYLLFFLTGDNFFIRLNHLNSLSEVHQSLMKFSSVSYYIIPQKNEKDFIASVMNAHSEYMAKNADDFLQKNPMPYLIYRVDTDAPLASGFSEEYCYGGQTPDDWLKYF